MATLTVPAPTKTIEWFETGFGTVVVSGEVIDCRNLDRKGYGYLVRKQRYYLPGQRVVEEVVVYEYTPRYRAPLNNKFYKAVNREVHINARDGCYKCVMSEYLKRETSALISNGILKLDLSLGETAYVRGGRGKGYLIRAYPSGKVTYYTRNCKYAISSSFTRDVKKERQTLIIPVKNIVNKHPTGLRGTYDECVFDWFDGLVDVTIVQQSVIKTWEVTVKSDKPVTVSSQTTNSTPETKTLQTDKSSFTLAYSVLGIITLILLSKI